MRARCEARSIPDRSLQLALGGSLALRRMGADATQGLLEQREPLREHLALVGEARDRQREVQQQRENEPEGDQEERVGRIRNADNARHVLQQPPPDREPEQDERAEQPQQRVALEQAAAPDQLEQHDDQTRGGEDRDDLDASVHQIPWAAVTAASSPGSTLARRRARPTIRARSTLIM